MTLDEATTESLVAELCRRLARGEPKRGRFAGPGELETSQQACEICHRLLEATKADGRGGCRLCQS